MRGGRSVLCAGVGPSWANPPRHGQVPHHGSRRGAEAGGSGVRQALDLNPDLSIAHKFYAQLEVDLGRAGDALARLLPRAQGAADPEIFAALISPLRYCGLLEASVA